MVLTFTSATNNPVTTCIKFDDPRIWQNEEIQSYTRFTLKTLPKPNEIIQVTLLCLSEKNIPYETIYNHIVSWRSILHLRTYFDHLWDYCDQLKGKKKRGTVLLIFTKLWSLSNVPKLWLLPYTSSKECKWLQRLEIQLLVLQQGWQVCLHLPIQYNNNWGKNGIVTKHMIWLNCYT